jgi:hypothetical protein
MAACGFLLCPGLCSCAHTGNAMTAERRVIRAASRVLGLVEAAVWGPDQAASEPGGLRHPKHATRLEPISGQATRVLQRFFRRQGRAVLKAVKPALQKLREASDDAKEKTAGVIPDPLPIVMTFSMGFDYSKALGAALSAGYEGLGGELGAESELAADTVKEYLTDHSLTKLTGNFDATTIDRLRNALADAYEEGADFDGMVQSLRDVYADFSETRAGLIWQTEGNNAYNAGRKQLGLDIGADEKSWATDGPNPCIECIANSAQGWIPMEDAFLSGDDMPTAHPGCYCSLEIRFSSATAQ